MSQLLTRLALCSRTTGRIAVRQVQSVRSSSSSPTTLEQEAAKFFARHSQRGSPQSPYMLGTTYKLQLTSVLSLTHRITGLGLGVLIYSVGLATLAQPSLNYEQILQRFKQYVPEVAISAVKFLAGTAIAFHTINGVRHLAWDKGYGFKIPDLYRSGYAVIALTLVAAAFLVTKGVLE